MRFALIIDGVVDTISLEQQYAPWVSVPDTVFAGFRKEGGVWVAPTQQPEPAQVPRAISFAQLLIGLVSEGWITADEGRAWRDRVALPAPVAALIATLPVGQQFAAETRAFAPSEIVRNDPLVLGLGAVAGKSEQDLDAFFLKYGAV